MKKFVLLWFLSTCTVTSGAIITPEVFLSDSNTPVEFVDANNTLTYPDIMVGTNLSIVIQSQTTEFGWIGTLTMPSDYLDRTLLAGRGYDGFSYSNSCLPAAGDGAQVWDWMDVGEVGLYFCSGYPALPGDWFVVDYNAVDVGSCLLELKEHCPPPVAEIIVIKKMQFHHVPSRDFNQDNIVNYKDFSIFASHWGKNDSNDCDINKDSSIDYKDLGLLADFWLVNTK